MKVLIQRVSGANVKVDGRECGRIGEGLLILLGIGKEDNEAKIKPLAEKVANLRIFEDQTGKMNLSLLDVKGEALVVSQFTLYADCSSGRRPAFTSAAAPQTADDYYKKFISAIAALGITTAEGEFGAHMHIELTNDGPVTIMVEM